MPAYSACDGTLFDITSGEPGTEVLGMTSIEWGEDTEISDYADNTTGCTRAGLVGPVTREGSITFNLQDGEDKGKLPFRARQSRTLQQHIDATGENYWELDVLFVSLSDYTHDLNSSDPVQATLGFRLQSAPIGFGTLAEASSS
jgi:hypothetical protein